MSLDASYPLYVGNLPESPNQDLEVIDKFTGEVATRVALADDATIDRAIGLAADAAEPMAAMAASPGPMKPTPASARARTKAAFSARNP